MYRWTAVLAGLLLLTPSTAWAEPAEVQDEAHYGELYSEVSFSADGETFHETPQWNVEGPAGNLAPGGRAATVTTSVRVDSENPQEFRPVVRLDPSLMDSEEPRSGNPRDLMITVAVNGETSEEFRMGDLYAETEPFDGVEDARILGEPVVVEGSAGDSVHTYEVQFTAWIPAGTGNEAQRTRFTLLLLTYPVPQQEPEPLPTEEPEPTEEPTPTEEPDPTQEPSPTEEPGSTGEPRA